MKLTAQTIVLALGTVLALTFITRAADGSQVEAQAIAKEAYTYGFPLVDNYRCEYAYFVDRQSPEFKAPWNQIANIPRVFTPADVAVQTPTRTLLTRGWVWTYAPNLSCSPCHRWTEKIATSAFN
jgi:hypothetical protein